MASLYSPDMSTATTPTQDKAPDQPMYVRLPAELHDAVKRRAQAEDRTMAQTIRVALRYYLNQTAPIA